jgi:hypothetical protein
MKTLKVIQIFLSFLNRRHLGGGQILFHSSLTSLYHYAPQMISKAKSHVIQEDIVT